MKTVYEADERGTIEAPVFVKPLINRLISAIHYCSILKGTLVINDVNPALKSGNDINVLAMVLGNLIKEAINYSENDCIRISSSDSGEIIFSSKKSDLARNRSFMVSVDSLQVIAKRLGTPVFISGSFNQGTEIFVCFNKTAA